MDVDSPPVNGATKRKSRSSITRPSYKEESDDSDDGQPLVRASHILVILSTCPMLTTRCRRSVSVPGQ